VGSQKVDLSTVDKVDKLIILPFLQNIPWGVGKGGILGYDPSTQGIFPRWVHKT
jgi:hypothetical protein